MLKSGKKTGKNRIKLSQIDVTRVTYGIECVFCTKMYYQSTAILQGLEVKPLQVSLCIQEMISYKICIKHLLC